jgi:glutathione S-transferase
MEDNDPHAPYTAYSAENSYFCGKIEAYLHYKGIEHTTVSISQGSLDKIYRQTGTRKVPAIETADKQWLIDTTPMMQWFDKKYPQGQVLPDDPALAFIALLIEDYADEWLWRPGLWWRWFPKLTRRHIARNITSKIYKNWLAIPTSWLLSWRQTTDFLTDDGVTKDNTDAVRDMLYQEFELLEEVFKQQPYMLGSHPSAADFGYFGPFFRHFGNDPAPAEEMRQKARNTYEWLARLWNESTERLGPDVTWVWPEGEHWKPLWHRISNDYLPYLHQNAIAFRDGKVRFDHIGASFQFNNTKTTHYRVGCRRTLQDEFAKLSMQDQQRVCQLVDPENNLEILSRDGVITPPVEDQQLPIPSGDKFKLPLEYRLIGQPRN